MSVTTPTPPDGDPRPELYSRASLDRLIQRFRRHFPSLDSRDYQNEERFYKDAFAKRLRELLSREALGRQIAAGEFEAAKAAVMQACGGSVVTPTGYRQANNLLNQWDRLPILNAPAEQVARRMYDLLHGDGPLDPRFEAWVELLGRSKPGVWAPATYFLMLHDPSEHLMVKPSQWQLFFKEAGVNLAWPTRPNAMVYGWIRSIARQLLADLAPLGAHDMIDVQSFLWRLNYREQSAWVFQASPEQYDLPGALAELDTLHWVVRQHESEIKPGDTVYLWEAGADAGILAVARVLSAPAAAAESAAERSFYRGEPATEAAEPRVQLQIDNVLGQRLRRSELAPNEQLGGMSILKNPRGTNFRLSAGEADALEALVSASITEAKTQPSETALEAEPDDDAADAGDEGLVGSLAEWRAGRTSQHPLVRRALDDYPAWLQQTFGDRIALRFYTRRPEIGIFIDGRWHHFVTFNAVKNGLYVLIDDLEPADVAELHRGLSRPDSVREREYASKTGMRFFAETEGDYTLLKELVTRTIGRIVSRGKQPPPDPLDGPAFVVTHKVDRPPEQILGQSYEYSDGAGGAPRQLTNALHAWRDGGPPVYLIIYRPGPHYSFTGWARVIDLRETHDAQADEMRYRVSYAWHPFPLPVSARDLQSTVPWLNKGLRIAFNGRSIQLATADDVRAIAERAYGDETKPMTIADAAFTILNRAEGGPLHLSDILARIQAEGLTELRGQTPQLSLASIMLRDERFRNLGRNTWVLADEEGVDNGTELPGTEESPEPPTREPAIYAEEGARFWRVHFPRELWDSARRAGIIAIGWPIDSPNQSVKRFRQIQPGDRVVAYVQGGVIGGIGAVSQPFDPANTRAGLPSETLGEEFNQYIRIAWADAPTEPVDLLDALRHPRYTGLYNRIKNPHTVIPLGRDDYTELLSLLQVDDAGLSPTESRLPNVWVQLAPYVGLARALGDRSLDALTLRELARMIDPPPAEPLDADDLVAELLQLRLIESIDDTRYRARSYVAGTELALLRLMVLALLVPVEGTADRYLLPSLQILPGLRGNPDPQPLQQFAPTLGADRLTLLGWYVEAGLVLLDGDTWRPAAGALDPLPGNDPAARELRLFLDTLQAELAGTLTADLPHVGADEALPPVDDLDGRLRELGQDLLFDSAVVRRIYRSLLAGRHVVLSGPPGTGKTELARRLPTLLWREPPQTFSRLTASPDQPPVEQVTEQREGYAPVLVTATEDWGVRDVVGGIGPRLDGQSGALSYTIEHGALTRVVLQHYANTSGGRQLPAPASGFARRDHYAGKHRHRGAWLVIDEFTRAPIDAAFGSLLTTLSGGQQATLAVPTREGEQRDIPLPRDFRIIGTLNSFDRHFLNQLSEAMKRRFDFIDVLPPSPAYADFEQGIAAKEALRRMHEDGFRQIQRSDDPPAYRWPNLLRVEPAADADGLRRYRLRAEAPEAEAALTSFWRLFSAIRVFRQLGTAQIVAVYLNLLTGVRVGMPWAEALDTALADALADQLQVLARDEQRTIDAFIDHAGQPAEFAAAVRAIVRELPPGRRAGYLYALREHDVAANGRSDIGVREEATLSDAQILQVFAAVDPLVIPPMGVFRRRLRDLIGERGL